MLDEEFRRGVQQIARSDESALDASARARILAAVRVQGPQEADAGKRRRSGAFAAAGTAVVAAAAAWVIHARTPSEEIAEVRSPSASEQQAVDALTRADTRPCARSAYVDDAVFEKVADGSRLRLGERASFFASGESSVAVEALEACRTVVSLDEGRVVVTARDLGGGDLIVESGEASVSVQGTIFSVARSLETITVEVAEGVVMFTRGTEKRRVVAGQSLQVSPVGVALSALPRERANALRRQAGETEVLSIDTLARAPSPAAGELTERPASPAVRGPKRRTTARPESPKEGERARAPLPELSETEADQPSLSPSELLSRAERERRSGRRTEARRLYRQAGAASGPTAEAAWLALARMELSAGNNAGARSALDEHARRFGDSSSLGPEAAWMNVRVHRAMGEHAAARREARSLVAQWPKAPQAAAARRFLAGG